MEDKKTLWVIIGIGVCVLIVAAVGFFWFLPSDNTVAGAASSENTMKAGLSEHDPVEWVRQDGNFPGVEKSDDKEKTDDFVVVSDELVYGETEKKAEDNKIKEPETQISGTEAITVEVPVETVKQPEPVKPAPVATVVASAPVQRPAPPKPAPVKEVRKSTRVTEYWIQAGSFSTLSKATEVKNKLGENGASSTISTVQVNGKNYYRVRLGPYAGRQEADKFLVWIKKINGFEKSYVSEVYVTK
ncbi:MAG: SPOR domain-containing protein [Spirochaetales bacterium]|nr:SPOR domain-containing protein [Spirochaetales bacterium]